jgi:hypothetical protein
MRKIAILLLSAGLIAGCGQPEDKPKGQVIARVDKTVLTLEEIRSAYGEAEWNRLSPSEQREQVQSWIDLTILSHETDNLGLNQQADVRFRIETAAMKIKANALMSKKLSTAEPTYNEMSDYYNAHKEQYTGTSPQFKIQRIFTRSRTKAEQALREIEAGMEMKQAVETYSEESSRENGGFVGFQGPADYSPEAWKTISVLPQYRTGLIQDASGFFVLRWYEQQTATQTMQSFEAVKPAIRAALIQQKKQAVLKSLLEELKSKSSIEIDL